jgi:hypothetical protein
VKFVLSNGDTGLVRVDFRGICRLEAHKHEVWTKKKNNPLYPIRIKLRYGKQEVVPVNRCNKRIYNSPLSKGDKGGCFLCC